MKGHIRKRGKGSWSIVLDIGRDTTGKRRQKWHSVKGTKRDAEQEMARLISEIYTGGYVEPSRLTVADYMRKWLQDAAARVAPKTLERYQGIMEGHVIPALGNVLLSKLKPLHIQSFYAKALADGRKDGKGGLSSQSVLHFHRVLHKALEQAVKWQLLVRNPADAVQPPRPQRQHMAALDENEISALLKSLDGNRLYLPVALAVATGLRRGELLALRWQDIDLESAQLTVARSLEQTKGNLNFKAPKTDRSRRRIALPQVIVRLLRAHKAKQAQWRLKLGPIYQDQNLVLARDDGAPWPPDNFSTAFADHIRRHPKLAKVRFHDLRHTHATQLLKQGVHPKIVSERLGHSNISITLDTYSHVLPGMQEQAIAALDASLSASIDS